MSVLPRRIIDGAQRAAKRIVLPETSDPRIINAALAIAQHKRARPILVGPSDQLQKIGLDDGSLPTGLEWVDLNQFERLNQYGEILTALKYYRSSSNDDLKKALSDPLIFAYCMLIAGDADGCVVGAATTTAKVISNALRLIGVKSGHNLVSSFMLMLFKQNDTSRPLGLPTMTTFADCALVVDPDSHQLAEIATATAANATLFLDQPPRVAMLSFSTAGSAQHAAVEKVIKAVSILKQKQPQLDVIGEIQFDAAITDKIYRLKTPLAHSSKPFRTANVFIFPNLDAANIGYKIAERIGGAQAIGPILQGLKHPVNDLSRGCSVNDIVDLVTITAWQASLR